MPLLVAPFCDALTGKASMWKQLHTGPEVMWRGGQNGHREDVVSLKQRVKRCQENSCSSQKLFFAEQRASPSHLHCLSFATPSPTSHSRFTVNEPTRLNTSTPALCKLRSGRIALQRELMDAQRQLRVDDRRL